MTAQDTLDRVFEIIEDERQNIRAKREAVWRKYTAAESLEEMNNCKDDIIQYRYYENELDELVLKLEKLKEEIKK